MRIQRNLRLTSGLQRLVIAGLIMSLLFSSISVVFAQGDGDGDPEPKSAEEIAGDVVEFTEDTAETTVSRLEAFVDDLLDVPNTPLVRLLLVIGGVVLLLAGWRVYDLILVIVGFLIGGSIAVSLITTDSTFMLVAAWLVGGIIGAALAFFFYILAVFLAGAYVGILLTSALLDFFSIEPVSAIVLFIGALIGGAILLGLSVEFLIIIAAIVGAQMLTLALALNPLWTVLLALVGVIVQFGLIRYTSYPYRRVPRRVNPFSRAFS
jgi:hypothetical protein